LNLVSFCVTPGELYEVRADGIADTSAARMQHHPNAVRFIQADFDEVVAAAERAELVRPARLLADALLDSRVLLDDAAQAFLEAPRRMVAHIAVVMLPETHRDIAAHLVEDFLERALVEIVARERKARRHHAAADVDPHRRRDDGAHGGDHRAHRGADAEMHVRHGGDVVMHDRQARDVDKLRARRGLDLAGVDPYRNSAFIDFLEDGHAGSFDSLELQEFRRILLQD
jgi:hypothetical protein